MSVTDVEGFSDFPAWAQLALEGARHEIERHAKTLGLDPSACLRKYPVLSKKRRASSVGGRLSSEEAIAYGLRSIIGAMVVISCSEDNVPFDYKPAGISKPTRDEMFFGALFAGVRIACNSGVTTINEVAQMGAIARHVETYALRGEVVAYWKREIDSKISNDKAATILERQFPLSHRKLAEYIASAKREMRSTSKA